MAKERKAADNVPDPPPARTVPESSATVMPVELHDASGDTEDEEDVEGKATPHTTSKIDDLSDGEENDDDGEDAEGEVSILTTEQSTAQAKRTAAALLAEHVAVFAARAAKPPRTRRSAPATLWYALNYSPFDSTEVPIRTE